MKAIIYAVGGTGKKIYHELKENNDVNIIAFSDANSEYWETCLYGIKIINPCEINKYDYDKIIIGTIADKDISRKLENSFGIPKEKIDMSYVDFSPIINRIKFLQSFSKIVYDKNIIGNVAEGGVFMGDFAKEINKNFPDRTLYLFDTFEGFSQKDVEKEQKEGFSKYKAGHYKTTEEIVKSVLPYPEKVIIRKGYFPETAEKTDDKFVFVNLDFDLYNPTLAGLEFFYPKMVHGGVILVHDYFTDVFKGVQKAVDEFCEKNNLVCVPIADELSVVIV